jgi:hypothetical protein
MTMFSRILPLALCLLALPGAAMAAPEHGEARRADGSAIRWTLDRPDGGGKAGLVVLAQGSGCLAAMQSGAMRQARAAFANLAALTVEKYGVAQDDAPTAPDNADCPKAFRDNHTLSQRVADYRQVVESLRGASWWNGALVLFGGSEGGLAMAMLAAEVDADAAILISTGGGVPFGQMVRGSIPEEGRPSADAAFEKARRNPESSELWAGHSLRFWADAIDRRAADDMLRADAGFLLIQGGRDVSGAPDAARAVNDLFAGPGRCNLTYWEFPGYDHGLNDRDGNERLSDVLAQSGAWLAAQLSTDREPDPCMRD